MISRTLLAGAAALLLSSSVALALGPGGGHIDPNTGGWIGSEDVYTPDDSNRGWIYEWGCDANSCSDGDDIGTAGEGSDDGAGGNGNTNNN